MIAKRIDRKAVSDTYRALALYIADAALDRESGEKTSHHWYAGGDAQDYHEGLWEVELTQGLNTRAKAAKTYHLLISFRPEDEPQLTLDVLRDIESTFAEALGFSEHQRHCGVHQNTDNPHLHIAYNTIHPQTLTRHAPYYDFTKLSQTCRTVEQKYGLAEDKGLEPGRPKADGRANAKVKTIEAQSGQESLFSYAVSHKIAIIADLEPATNWRAVHEVFLKRGLVLKLSGNGLAIKDRYGQHAVKASDLGRNLSKSQLVKRFGSFQEPAPELLRTLKSEARYSARPLHLGPERGRLYETFQTDLAQRRERLEAIQREGRICQGASREHWAQKRLTFARLPMLNRDRQRVKLEIKKREAEDLSSLRAELAAKCQAVREEYPYTSWGKYLQYQATQGQETALAILRSKRELVQPEQDGQRPAPPANNYDQSLKWLERQKEALAQPGLTKRHRRALQTVLKMRELLEQETTPGTPTPKVKYRLDTKGTVIFTLPDGATIRDTGGAVHFSANNDLAARLAEKLTRSRGQRLAIMAPAPNQPDTIEREPPTVNLDFYGRS